MWEQTLPKEASLQGQDRQEHRLLPADGKETDEMTGPILAAGYSSRMGAFKPCFGGRLSSLARVIRALKVRRADEAAVVTGHKRELYRKQY